MVRTIKKGLFRILSWSMVIVMIFAVSVSIWQNLPTYDAKAAPAGSMTATTLLMKGNETKAINAITIVDSGAEITALMT
jgi:hypothetical protein